MPFFASFLSIILLEFLLLLQRLISVLLGLTLLALTSLEPEARPDALLPADERGLVAFLAAASEAFLASTRGVPLGVEGIWEQKKSR